MMKRTATVAEVATILALFWKRVIKRVSSDSAVNSYLLSKFFAKYLLVEITNNITVA